LGWHTCFVPQLLHAAATVGAARPVHIAPELPPLLLPPLLLPPLEELDELDDEELEEDPLLDELEPAGFVALPASGAVPPPSAACDVGLFPGSVVVPEGVGSVGSVVVSAPAPVPVSVAPTAHARSPDPTSSAALSGAMQA
jgi:hypothetical protein